MYQAKLFNLFLLKEFCTDNFGQHYPRDIIYLILSVKIKTIRISCGQSQTFISRNNTIYAAGSNLDGRLGLGDCIDKLNMVKFEKKDIKKIVCGGFHTVALSFNPNKICVWGYNNKGQLGLGHTVNEKIPKEVILPEKIKSVSCGREHTIVLAESGAYYGFGDNRYFQLGLGDTNNKLLPTKNSSVNFKKIYSGHSFNFAKTICGQIYSWGSNRDGQLGLGNYTSYVTPQKCNLSNVISISCGVHHAGALLYSGKVYTWGKNCYGKLGHNTNVLSMTEIDIQNIMSLKCGSDSTIFLDKFGDVYICGRLSIMYNLIPIKLAVSRITKCILGNEYCLLLKYDDSCYVFGHNESGQLGLGDTVNQLCPKQLIF